MRKPFSRDELQKVEHEFIAKYKRAHANVYLYRKNGRTWVVKDFLPCGLLVRKTWGRFLIKREYRALSRLRGIEGIPEEPFLMDENALCYLYRPGERLLKTPPCRISGDFFFRLEDLVRRMHERNMVHLDLRNRSNIIITDQGLPALLDFQSCLNLDWIPRGFHQLLKDIDLSGVYKIWQRKKPDTMDYKRKAMLAAMNKRKALWLFGS